MKKDGIHRVPSIAIGLETFVSLTQVRFINFLFF